MTAWRKPNTKPEEDAIERAREDEREGNSPSTQAGEFVREGEHAARSPEYAIAIGLSKARRAGVKREGRAAAARTSLFRRAKKVARRRKKRR